MLEIIKTSSKTRDRCKANSDLQNKRERFLLKLGIGNSVEIFKIKLKVPRYRKYSCPKGQGYSCLSEAILEEFDLPGKLKSFEIICIYDKVLFPILKVPWNFKLYQEISN